MIEFTHTLIRFDGPDENEGREIELEISATVYANEIDDVSWTPDITLTRDEEAAIQAAAVRELDEARECARIEAAEMRAEERRLAQMGW